MGTDCFVVKIVENYDDTVSWDEQESTLTFTDFRLIEQGCPDLIAELNRHKIISCGSCGSFQIPAIELYRLYENSHHLLGDGNNEAPSLANEFLSNVINQIEEEFSVSDEEFISFMTTGKPQLNPLYDRKGELVYSESKDYDLRRLAYSHIGFKFGSDCDACNRLYHHSVERDLR